MNLHPREALRHVGVLFPTSALQMIGLKKADLQMRFTDRLAAGSAMEIELSARELAASNLRIPEIPPLTACYFEVTTKR